MHFATQRQLAREEERAAWVNLQLPAQLQKRLWWPIHVRWSEDTQSCKPASISREVASSRDFDSSSLALLTVRATEPGGSSAEKTIGTMPTGVESEAARAGWAGRIRGRGTTPPASAAPRRGYIRVSANMRRRFAFCAPPGGARSVPGGAADLGERRGDLGERRTSPETFILVDP